MLGIQWGAGSQVSLPLWRALFYSVPGTSHLPLTPVASGSHCPSLGFSECPDRERVWRTLLSHQGWGELAEGALPEEGGSSWHFPLLGSCGAGVLTDGCGQGSGWEMSHQGIWIRDVMGEARRVKNLDEGVGGRRL